MDLVTVNLVLNVAMIALLVTIWRDARKHDRYLSVAVDAVGTTLTHLLRHSTEGAGDVERSKAFEEYAHARFHELLNDYQKTLLLMSLPESERRRVAARMSERDRRAADKPPSE